MRTVTFLLLALALAGCAVPEPELSACAHGESSYACQVERYRNAAY